MRLTCPNCKAQYEVADSAIPARGRDVQCSSCGHAWFERPDASDVAEPEPLPATQEVLQPVEEPPVEAAAPPSRALDPAVAEILRAEASREARERRQEAETGLQSQEEFPFEATDNAPPEIDEEEVAASVGFVDATARKSKVPRRDLLPDIEEINSSLRAKSVLRAGAAEALTEEEREERARRGRGFRIGFSSILLVALFALLLYGYADNIVRSAPGLSAPVEAYVNQINALRLWLDAQMASGASAISGVLQGAGN